MKYDCANEFDLNEIYRKLTSPSQAPMVKASEFFAPVISLAEFTMRMESVMSQARETN